MSGSLSDVMTILRSYNATATDSGEVAALQPAREAALGLPESSHILLCLSWAGRMHFNRWRLNERLGCR